LKQQITQLTGGQSDSDKKMADLGAQVARDIAILKQKLAEGIANMQRQLAKSAREPRTNRRWRG
jgi:hypothetical protein